LNQWDLLDLSFFVSKRGGSWWGEGKKYQKWFKIKKKNKF
jgi:hypothetical protein